MFLKRIYDGMIKIVSILDPGREISVLYVSNFP